MSHFHPLEIVGRGSETQLQVDEKYSYSNLSGLKVNPVLTLVVLGPY